MILETNLLNRVKQLNENEVIYNSLISKGEDEYVKREFSKEEINEIKSILGI